MKFHVKTTKNRKVVLNMEAINAYASRWKPGTQLEVEIKRPVAKKSDSQRAFYWAVVIPQFCDELGYDPDERELFHRQLKITYFGVKPDAKGIYRNKDIPAVFANESDKDVRQKKEFIEWVVRKAAQNGIYISCEEDE